MQSPTSNESASLGWGANGKKGWSRTQVRKNPSSLIKDELDFFSLFSFTLSKTSCLPFHGPGSPLLPRFRPDRQSVRVPDDLLKSSERRKKRLGHSNRKKQLLVNDASSLIHNSVFRSHNQSCEKE